MIKKRCIAFVVIICVCFVSIAGYCGVLSSNKSLRIETLQKLATTTCIEGTITTADGFIISSVVNTDDYAATVHKPYIYSCLVGPRIPCAKPSVYSSNIDDYKDTTQSNTLRNILFDNVCMDTDGDGYGSDCVLTINSKLQEYIYNLIISTSLTKVCDTSVVVIDNNSGAIKSIISYKASFPQYDVNKFTENYNELSKIKEIFIPEYLNPCSPGSVFKVISSIPVIERGFDMDIYNDTGSIEIGGSSISNYHGISYGKVNLSGALQNSLNTYFVDAYTTTLGSSDLSAISKKAMIGEPFESDIWELTSAIRNDSIFETAQASFGQGVSVTPIGICAAFSGIINNGKMLRPYIVDSLSSSLTGNIYYEGNPETVSTITSVQISKKLLSYLHTNVTDKYAMKNALYAKTGTAEVGNHNAIWIVCGNEKYSITIRCVTDELTHTGSQLCDLADKIMKMTDSIE